MTFLNRLGLRRRNSTKKATPPGDLSEDEVDLDVFNPFTQSDMGITPDGKPISSFSSGSAYTAVDSPRMTMEDFLQRAQNAVADGRRQDTDRAVTIDPTANRPRGNRVAFSSDPELRRVAARNSLHRRFQVDCAASIDLTDSNVVPGKNVDADSEAQAILERFRPSRARPNVRPASLAEDETPNRSRFSFEYSSPNISRCSLSLASPKSRLSDPQTNASTPPQSFPETPARPVAEDGNAPAFSSSRNHSALTAPVPSFQKVAGYKYELPQERTMRQSIRQAELLSIPSRPSPTITRHRDPHRTSKVNGIKPAVNHVPEPTIKRSIEVAYMRRPSSVIGAKIQKEDPRSKQERMLNTATKRWSFWGSINRAGDDVPKFRRFNPRRRNPSENNDVSVFELEHSDDDEEDEDRTEAFRSIEHDDEQTKARILDAHLAQIMEAATVYIKDKIVMRTVQIVDRDVRGVYPRTGLIESAREEVRLSACGSEQRAETSSKDGKKEMKSEEEERSSRKMSALMTRLLRRGSKTEPETANE